MLRLGGGTGLEGWSVFVRVRFLCALTDSARYQGEDSGYKKGERDYPAHRLFFFDYHSSGNPDKLPLVKKEPAVCVLLSVNKSIFEVPLSDKSRPGVDAHMVILRAESIYSFIEIVFEG